jgi:exodeoxyribonuclease V gamma subunit
MLRIVRSNRVESLLAALAARLADEPLASPFIREQVLVPSPAMGRWVNLQLARAHGVAANLAYPLPASFVWGLCADLLADLLEDVPETDPLGRERMTWRTFSLLPALLGEPAFEPLRRYLTDDTEGLKRWQLAGRVADVFDRYQLYRPEFIRDWDAGQGDDWQAPLWRHLSAGLADRHRVAVIGRLLETLAAAEPPRADLPRRVSLFAVSTLPPLLVEVMQALAAHVDVDLYLHAPTPEFWSDLVSQKTLARKRLATPDEADLWEVGNPLLASWGRQGQALQDLLLSADLPMDEEELFAEPSGDSILSCLQRDIYRLRAPLPREQRRTLAPDDSLQVHVCHSPLRECQVLHDRLLAMLEADPDLCPEDILVMIPDISGYAPYIEAVFDRDRDDPRPSIPWNLSDISVADEHPLVAVFLSLLDLPRSRFSYSEILSYLDVPELAAHFGLDADAVVRVKSWLAAANLRWGLDGAHKARLGLPPEEENTWAQARARLFGGYALGDSDPFDGISPIADVEGGAAESLGQFWRLLSLLDDAAGRLTAPRDARGWQLTMQGLLADFFGEREDEDGRIQKIRDAAAELAEQADGDDTLLSPALVRRWMEERLGSDDRHGRYFSGGVSICGMRPMRSLPFKVICVLGLDDKAFPRRERPSEFDRMRSDWKPGDPRGGDEDRYLFLETLLCARRRLYLGYVGRDMRRNSALQPSVLLRELLDYLDQQYLPDGEAGDRPLSECLTHAHPMQPFSPANFSGPDASYDAYWCGVAEALAMRESGSAQAERDLSGGRLADAPEPMRELTLMQLHRFLRHPMRYLVNSRLRIYLREEAAEEDDEVFALDHLSAFFLKQRLADGWLRDREPSPEILRAEGALPHGTFAELAYTDQQDALAPLRDRLAAYRGADTRYRDLQLRAELADGSLFLSGRIAGIHPELGLLRYRPSKIKGVDRLALWIDHLAWCAAGGGGPSSLFTSDGGFVFRDGIAPDEAQAKLKGYLDLYWAGIHRPLPLLTGASYAYASSLHKSSTADPMTAAWRDWAGNGFMDIPGDRDDAYVQLLTRGAPATPLDSPAFAELATSVYGDLLRAGEAI